MSQKNLITRKELLALDTLRKAETLMLKYNIQLAYDDPDPDQKSYTLGLVKFMLLVYFNFRIPAQYLQYVKVALGFQNSFYKKPGIKYNRIAYLLNKEPRALLADLIIQEIKRLSSPELKEGFLYRAFSYGYIIGNV